MNRIVKLVYPRKSSNEAMVSELISRVPLSKKDMTIYDTVDFFAHEIFSKSKIKIYSRDVTNYILLRDVMNIHNDTGIRDIFQINSMIKQIRSGNNVLDPNGLPNTKLVKTKYKTLLLFDGHHSFLAYMLADRKYLNEIPHLIVEDEKNVYVSDKEILVFFGEHSTGLEGKDWSRYVINWQAPKEKQIEKRIQNNMGELLDSLVIQ